MNTKARLLSSTSLRAIAASRPHVLYGTDPHDYTAIELRQLGVVGPHQRVITQAGLELGVLTYDGKAIVHASR